MKWFLTLATLVFVSSAIPQCRSRCDDVASVRTTTREAEFLAEANRMALAAEGKTACCRTTATRVVAKGDAGCCNAKGETARFKVFVDGRYRLFGCDGSARKAREEMIASGRRVGPVQPVTGRARL